MHSPKNQKMGTKKKKKKNLIHKDMVNIFKKSREREIGPLC